MDIPKIKYRLNQCDIIAIDTGWKKIDYQQNIGMVSYSKIISSGMARINIYLTKMSVTTYLNHPKKGKGQLYRKNIGWSHLIKIFKNPRFHTGKGYYKKSLKSTERINK